jgi:hypothetical protein
MKKTLLISLVMVFGTSLSVLAAERGRPLTPEQKQQRDAVIQKYDANKDGVLDKTEIKSLSKADKKTLAKTGGVPSIRSKDKDKASEEAEKVEKTEKAAKDQKEKAEQDLDAKSKSKGRGGK